jgi:hypothetical protein
MEFMNVFGCAGGRQFIYGTKDVVWMEWMASAGTQAAAKEWMASQSAAQGALAVRERVVLR